MSFIKSSCKTKVIASLYLNLHSKGFMAYRAHFCSVLHLIFTVTLRYYYSHFIEGELEAQCNSQSHCSWKWGRAIPGLFLLVLSFLITKGSSLYILWSQQNLEPQHGTTRDLQTPGRKKSRAKKSQSEVTGNVKLVNKQLLLTLILKIILCK